jgi:histidine triad (HIT) family protein
MPTVFTMIINGDIPGRFVWKDDKCVAFLTINPLRPGHTLVVPRDEVDHWLDLDADLLGHLSTVSQSIGKAMQRAFQPKKVGLMIAGLEVPHVHMHLVPIINEVRDLDFANAEQNPDPDALDQAADAIRTALRELGYQQVSD